MTADTRHVHTFDLWPAGRRLTLEEWRDRDGTVTRQTLTDEPVPGDECLARIDRILAARWHRQGAKRRVDRGGGCSQHTSGA